MARKVDPAKRDAILKAARAIFKKRSFTETTVSEITRKAGVATGTFYLYFKSKLDVVDALCDHYLVEQTKHIKAGWTDRDIRRSIANAVHASLAHSAKNADLVRLIDLRRSYAGSHASSQADRDIQGLVRSWLSNGIDRGLMRTYNPKIMAEIITGLLEYIAKVCFTWHDIDPNRYEATIVEILQRALIIDHTEKLR
jgi:AcrR family transcriptional regulator